MTIQEFNNWVKENGLGPDTEITFSDYSGSGTVSEDMLNVEGIYNDVMGQARTLDIDVT